MNKDNYHSWVRISHGLNKLVTNFIDKEYDDNEQETSTTKTEVLAFASRSKARAKPRKPSTACSSSRTLPTLERRWIDFEPDAQFDQAYPIEFWRLKDDLESKFEYSQYRSHDVLKSKMLGGWGNTKRFQYCTELSGEEFFLSRALQGPSGRNTIDLSLQDNVLIPNNFFEYIIMLDVPISAHSITNSGFIAGGQLSNRDRQTVFFTAVNPTHKNHQASIELDLSKPRLACYKRKWKLPEDTVYWVDLHLDQRKGLKFYQTRSNAVILYDTLPAYCISKEIVMKSEEIINQKVYVSPRPPPKISYTGNELDVWCGFWCCKKQWRHPTNRTKTDTQSSRTGRLFLLSGWETLERTKFERDTLNQEKHENVTDPTSTGKNRMRTRIHRMLRVDT